MKPIKEGQIVQYKNPFPDEDPNQRFVILEIHFDVEKPRALIKELNGGKPLASTLSALVDDLEVIEVDTSDLVGHEVSINKADNSQAIGKVVKVSEKRIMLDLTKGFKGVETNVWLTIQDEKSKEHTGTLFVN